MKPSQLSRRLSMAMSTIGLGGALYSAIEWIRGPATNSVKYEILFVMWLALGIGWGSRLLPERRGERRQAAEQSSPVERRDHKSRE
jgi:hypothetical protein